MRQARADDKTIAAITLCGNLAWVGVCLLFGLSIKNVLDPRVLMHAVTALLLALLSIRTLRV